MSTCTAPKEGHKNPAALAACPSCGPKPQKKKNLPNNPFSPTSKKEGLAERKYEDLNTPEKALRDAHIQELAEDFGPENWNKMSNMDKAYELNALEESIDNGAKAEISHAEHVKYRKKAARRYLGDRPHLRPGAETVGTPITATATDTGTLTTGERDTDLTITKLNKTPTGTNIITAVNGNGGTHHFAYSVQHGYVEVNEQGVQASVSIRTGKPHNTDHIY